MIVSKSLTTGELMSLLAYCMNILMNLMMISMIFVMVSMSTASVRRIGEILSEESDLSNPENPIYEVNDGRIVFKNVDFAYKKGAEHRVLKEINLEGLISFVHIVPFPWREEECAADVRRMFWKRSAVWLLQDIKK